MNGTLVRTRERAHRIAVLLQDAAEEVDASLGSGQQTVASLALHELLTRTVNAISVARLGTSPPPNLQPDLQARWTARQREVIAQHACAVASRATDEDWWVDDLAMAYDQLQAFGAGDVHASGSARAERRAKGRYLTPPSLAAPLTHLTVNCRDYTRPPRIIDPAAGPGTLLLQVLRQLPLGSDSKRAVATNLFAIDLDPIAIGLARRLIWLECGDPSWDGEELCFHLRVGDALLADDPTWADWFPEILPEGLAPGRGGFDVVLTNPPWEAVRPLRSEFFASWQGLPESAAEAWRQHALAQQDYGAALRSSGAYAHQNGAGSSDKDLYKFFMERIFQLTHASGCAGMLLPGGFLRTAGAKSLRRLYFQNGEFEWLVEFINRRRLFPIHSMFRFLLAVYRRGAPPHTIRRYAVGVTDTAEIENRTLRHQRLSREFLTNVGGITGGVPEVRDCGDAKLLRKLHAAHPPLAAESAAWTVRFTRELDMTNDSRHFLQVAEAERTGWSPRSDGSWTDRGVGERLPVYEGRMVHQYTAAAKSYVSGSGRKAIWEPTDGAWCRPQFLVNRDIALNKVGRLLPRAGYCDISGHANERTMLAALLPAGAVCGNKVPTVRPQPADPRLHLLWLGVVNSFVYDWLCRRWVSTSMNFFYLEHLPFPRLEPRGRVGRRVLESVSKLVGATPSRELASRAPVADPWRRASLRARLDALVAQTYGLTRGEYAEILRDFSLLDRGQPALPDERTSTVTHDLAMLAFTRLEGSEDTRLTARVRAARQRGAVAYQPSEWVRAEH